MSDHDGQATSVSIIVRVRRFGGPWYRALFAAKNAGRNRVHQEGRDEKDGGDDQSDHVFI